jgi:hypothetical protein
MINIACDHAKGQIECLPAVPRPMERWSFGGHSGQAGFVLSSNICSGRPCPALSGVILSKGQRKYLSALFLSPRRDW